MRTAQNAYLIAVKTSTAVAYVKRIRQASMATGGESCHYVAVRGVLEGA